MNYDQMSDFEINKAVSLLIGEQIAGTRRSDLSAIYIKTVSDYDGLDTITKKDYCNNPSDAWPIIVNNGISICFVLNRKIWQAAAGINPWCLHENPLRAAMIVYLMMQENDE